MLGSAFRFPVSRGVPSPLSLAPLGWEGQALVADVGGTLHCWGTRIGAILWTEIPASPRENCRQLTWVRSPEGDVLILGAADGGPLVWNGRTGLPVPLPDGGACEARLLAVAAGALPGGGVLVVGAGDDGNVYRWDLRTGRSLPALTGHGYAVSSVLLVDPPGERPMIVSSDDGGTVLRWDALSGERIGAPMTLPGGLLSVGSSTMPDGRVLIVGVYGTGILHRWNAVTGAPFGRPIRIRAEKGERPRPCFLSSFSHDGVPGLLVCVLDRPLQAWNAVTGAFLGSTSFPVRTAVAAKNADGRLMLAVDGGKGEALVFRAAEVLTLHRKDRTSRPKKKASR